MLFYLETMEVNFVDADEVFLPCSISVRCQLFPVSIRVPDPPVWSFVVIYFGPATLDPSLSVGEVPPDQHRNRYLQQSVCSVSYEAFTACSGSGPVAG